MVTLLVLMLALGSDGTGSSPEPGAEVLAARQQTRARWSLALAGAGGYGSAYGLVSGSGGLSLDAGLVFADKVALSLRVTGTLGLGATLLAGLSVDRALGDELQLGAGLSFALIGGFFDFPDLEGLVVPIRAAWMFSGRSANAVARRGFFLFGELSPGVSFLGNPADSTQLPGMPPSLRSPVGFLATAVVGFGYAAW